MRFAQKTKESKEKEREGKEKGGKGRGEEEKESLVLSHFKILTLEYRVKFGLTVVAVSSARGTIYLGNFQSSKISHYELHQYICP